MKDFLDNLREALKSGYKFYFYFWVGSIIIFSLSLAFLMREVKYFMALQESQRRLDESFQRIQPQVVRIRENLKNVDWQRTFKKEVIYLSLALDLVDLKKTIGDLQSFTREGDTLFLLQEFSFKREKEKAPVLLLKGEIIKFH